MTSPSEKGLQARLTTSLVSERDEAFAVDLLGKVRRDRQRGLVMAFVWTAALAALIGLLAAGFFMGGLEAARLAFDAVVRA